MRAARLLLALGALALLLQVDRLPLVLVVRDGAGRPLAGVALEVLVMGPPHEAFASCVTDEVGACRLLLPPGAYLVRFGGGWGGRAFVPAEDQNGGGLEDGTTGGFGVYLTPADGPQTLAFVVGVRDGQLVPLWDLSAEPGAAPQPYGADGVELGGLAGEGAQVATTELAVGAAPTAAPAPPVQAPAAPELALPAGLPAALLPGLAALAGLAALFLVLVGALMAGRRLRLRRSGGGR